MCPQSPIRCALISGACGNARKPPYRASHRPHLTPFALLARAGLPHCLHLMKSGCGWLPCYMAAEIRASWPRFSEAGGESVNDGTILPAWSAVPAMRPAPTHTAIFSRTVFRQSFGSNRHALRLAGHLDFVAVRVSTIPWTQTPTQLDTLVPLYRKSPRRRIYLTITRKTPCLFHRSRF
jgi:hypothetical protein